ncbi:MAG: 1-deoxy-D-xylulose-5-phosphate synthase [Alphaproteobacteria bacterium ADurb.Bin438]|nr:MAG: 1-deoxy-D-xylulose-5-phosphate synthase [Alphaproteobacteria bacterium ADurb.Bin438]
MTLEKVNNPNELKQLSVKELPNLSQDIRDEIITTVSNNGGHLGSSLGAVELAIALHYVFDAPKDKIIWDVGHQAYAHKLLTERKDRFHTIRKPDGLSGFVNRFESKYDPIGTGHSSTSISAGLGMAVGRDLKGAVNNVISVIGDGSMSAGMAFEAMNNAGSIGSRFIVILNDNEMSISPPVGALSAHLSRIISSKSFVTLRQMAIDVASYLPKSLEEMARRAESHAKGMVTGGTLFEEMGFYYIGPIDGHNFDHLIPILKNIKDTKLEGPILIHAITKKGKGYEFAENKPSKYHGVSKFEVETGNFIKKENSKPTFTSAFSQAICEAGELDPSVVAITAAMPSGTGLSEFSEKFPKRFFDVGIAEQHAVTFGAGLALEKIKPFVAIYSSFLQRAYDQVMHDVALQCLPVRFAIDRAGFVGDDGATHHGIFDLPLLLNLPNMVVMAPSDQDELIKMVATQMTITDMPSAIRYPRGEGVLEKTTSYGQTIPFGKAKIVNMGEKVAVLSLGNRLKDALKAKDEIFEKYGINITVVDARFAKPFDADLVKELAKNHEALITVEEGVNGGFGSLIGSFLINNGLLDDGLKFRSIFIPDVFYDNDTADNQCKKAGIDSVGIANTVSNVLNLKQRLDVING